MSRSKSVGTTMQSHLARGTARMAGRVGSLNSRLACQLEAMEPRQLLSGDHPSLGAFPNPPADSITLDVNGLGSATGILDTSSDNDTFSFVAPSNDFVSVLADTVNEASATLNSKIEVYTATGTRIQFTDGSASRGDDNGQLTSGLYRDGWMGFVATAGDTYYVVVRAQNNTSGTYTVRVDAKSTALETLPPPNPLDPQPPYFDPDDPPILDQGSGKIRNTVNRAGMDFVYRFDLTNTTTVPSLATAAYDSLFTVNAQAVAGFGDPTPNGTIDTRIEVYDATGQLVVSDSDAGNRNDAFNSFVSHRNTVWYIRVRSDVIAPASAVATGTFVLAFDASATNLVVDPVVRYDDHTAQNYVGGTGGGLGSAQETQMFSFIAQGNGLAFVTVVPAGLPPLTDPAVRLINDQGTLIRFNDDFNGLSSQIEVALVGGSRYYVIVDTFDNTSGGGYYMAIESNHTFNAGTDDHVNNNPNIEATPLKWGPMFDLKDADGNRVLDIGFKMSASGAGRIYQAGDTDTFSFVLPQDQIAGYTGNDDDLGTALYVGGLFDTADPSRLPNSVGSRNLAIYDASDWWFVGRQGPLTTEATPRLFGFNDNATTITTAGAEIYTLFDWTPVGASGDNSHVLVVGGDFDLVLPNLSGDLTDPPRIIKNLAAWAFNPLAGRYQWARLTAADPNGAVRAATTWDPTPGWYPAQNFGGETPPPAGTPTPIPTDEIGQLLVLGGDFTNLGNRVIGIEANGNILNIDTGITTGQVRALTVYDPPSVSVKTRVTTTTTSGSTDADEDVTIDIPRTLMVGGSFTGSTRLPNGSGNFTELGTERGRGLIGVSGLVRNPTSGTMRPVQVLGEKEIFWDGTFTPTGSTTTRTWHIYGLLPGEQYYRIYLDVGSIDGEVNALTVYDPIEAAGVTITHPLESRLVVGGLFTGAGIGAVANTNSKAFTQVAGRQNLYEWGVLDFGAGVANPGGGTDTTARGLLANPYGLQVPAAAFSGLGARGTNGAVLALAVWDPPDVAQADFDNGPRLIVGGSFTTFGGATVNNVAGDSYWNGIYVFGTALAPGVNGPVRALTSFQDDQEPGRPNDQDVLYMGGDFTRTTTGIQANRTISWFFNPAAARFVWAANQSGVGQTGEAQPPAVTANISVRALTSFDDGIRGQWDRNDRPNSRPTITVAPTQDSFMNAFIDVFDSTGNLIYSNDNTDADFISTNIEVDQNPTDPAGSKDPSLTPGPGYERQWVLPPLWAGETYYIRVRDRTNSGTGRFTLSITVDAALPTDVNGDGLFDDINASIMDVPDFGQWLLTAARAELDIAPASGDVENVKGTTTDAQAYNFREMTVMPAVGLSLREMSDVAVISTIDDTDVYLFRPNFTGSVEIRTQTVGIARSWVPQGVAPTRPRFGGLPGGTIPGADTALETVLNSDLDGYIRVFSNDFHQIGYNDDNTAIGSALAADTVGAFAGNFTRRDSRVVLNVIAGGTYYVEVGSAQKYLDGSAELPADRTLNGQDDIDWRFVTGAYRLLVHTQAFLPTDIENGQTVQDDHANAPFLGNGTPALDVATRQIASIINIDGILNSPTGGMGSATGVINNTALNPDDSDTFGFTATGTGQLTVTLTSSLPGVFVPQAWVYEVDDQNNIQQIASGVALTGTTVMSANGTKGSRYFVVVNGSGGSEGTFTLDVATAPAVDDFVDRHKFSQATEIPMRDFLGRGDFGGSIESPGDIDMFKFQVFGFHTITATITGLDATLNPVIRVYEYTEDAAGNSFIVPIAFNDDISVTNTNARVMFSVNPNHTSGATTRSYPFYIIEVADAASGFGRYNIQVTFPQTDDYPDINEFTFATPITVDSVSGIGTAPGNIEKTGDTDLVLFIPPATGPATITIARTGTSTLRLKASLIDSDTSTVIDTVTGADTLGATSITLTATNLIRGATYYILIEAATPNTVTTDSGTYSIAINATPQDDYPNATEWSIAHGLTLSAATGDVTLGNVAGGLPGNPRINPANDTDLFTFTTIAAGDISIIVTPYNTGLGNLNPRIRLYDLGHNLLQTVSGGAAGTQATLTITGATSGTVYFILVDADTTGGGTAAGEYRLDINGPTSGGGGGGGGGGGNNHGEINFADPTDILLDARTGDGSAGDQIEISGDRDLFRFTSPARTGRLFVQVVTADGSTLDASVTVLSSANETAVASTDSVGVPGATANTSFQALASHTYYVIVAGVGSTTGSYTVKVNALPAQSQLVFPEGFATTSIREFISISNPNTFDVNYRVIFRYEDNSPETLAYVGTAPAGARDPNGVTVIDGPGFHLPGLRLNTPYSIIVESDYQLGATFAHYDFGSTLGEALTERTSNQWAFPRVERVPGEVKDFIVFYNPNNFPVNVTLTAFQVSTQTPISVTVAVQGLRRGGLSIDDLPAFPFGVFGATLTSAPVDSANNSADIGIVASISHYNIIQGAGFSALGDPDMGTTSGALGSMTSGSTTTSDLTFLNSTAQPITVTLQGNYLRANLPQITRTFNVEAHSTLTFSGTDLGLAADQPVGFTYTTNTAPITAIVSQVRFGDGDAVQSTNRAGLESYFGDAFMDPATAGTRFFEFLTLYNPTGVNASISVKLQFLDGTSSTVNTQLLANRYGELRMHELTQLTSRSGPTWYSITVTSDVPMMNWLSHYDLNLGGGWTSGAVNFGITIPLTSYT